MMPSEQTSTDSADPSRRSYDSPRRREQAQQTRDQIAEAARQLFLERGWAQTTVRDIARAAGVSDQTVYNTYGGKSGLAVALVDAVDLSADVPRQLTELKAAIGDPSRQLAAMVAFDRRLFERCGDVIRLLTEARTEPELIDAVRQGRSRGDVNRRRVFSSWPAQAFRPGVDVTLACDMFAALCHVDVYIMLTTDRGWHPDQVERWWHDSLVQLLLA